MRQLRIVLLGLLLMGVVALPALAQLRTIPMAAEKSELTLVEQRDDFLVYRVTVGSIDAMDVMTKEGPFTRLLIPGFHTSKIEGAPELPMMNRLIEIPYGAASRIEVVSSHEPQHPAWRTIGITNPLFPAQPSMPKNADPATVPFVYDRAAYATAKVGAGAGPRRGSGTAPRRRASAGSRSPRSSTYPAENRIVVHDSIEFRVHFDGADAAGGAALEAEHLQPLLRRPSTGWSTATADSTTCIPTWCGTSSPW